MAGPATFLEEITPLYSIIEIGGSDECYYKDNHVIWYRSPIWPWILLAVGSGIMFVATVVWVISQYLMTRSKSVKIFESPLVKNNPSDDL